jgi:hypothetical protein
MAVLSVLLVLNLGTECDINDVGLKSLIWLLSLTKLVSSIRYSCKNIASFSFQDNDKTWMYPVDSTVGAIVDIKGTEHKRFDFGIELSDMTAVLPVLNLGTECDINDVGLKSLIWLLSLRSNKTTSIVLVLLTTSAASCKLAL